MRLFRHYAQEEEEDLLGDAIREVIGGDREDINSYLYALLMGDELIRRVDELIRGKGYDIESKGTTPNGRLYRAHISGLHMLPKNEYGWYLPLGYGKFNKIMLSQFPEDEARTIIDRMDGEWEKV